MTWRFRPIFPRKRIDITWIDILFAIYYTCWLPALADISSCTSRIECLWVPSGTFISLSVRTTLDLVLQACRFPLGSEVIISAVTIPHMAQIIRLHGLVPKAVDLSIKDLSVSARNVEALITPRTRAVLVAHLFGNRYSLRELSRVTRHHKLLLIEDCAQAFVGRSFTGDEDATISLFSFGPIKTCTAFGGALATIRDPELLLVMKAMQDNAPAQGQLTFLKRIIKYAGLKSLTQNAYIYGFFISLLNLLGKDHHQVIAGLGHSFSSEAALLSQIRFRPSLPLVNLLEHRLRRFDPAEIQDRTRCVTDLANLLPLSLQPIGFVSHVSRPGVSLSYWICPIRVNDPSATLKALFDAGFDAARGDSSLIVVLNGGTTPIRAREVMASVIYVPVDNQFTSSLAQCLIHTTRA